MVGTASGVANGGDEGGTRLKEGADEGAHRLLGWVGIMSMRVTTESVKPGDVPLDRNAALRRAWVWYLAVFSLPVVGLAFFGWSRLMDQGAVISGGLSNQLFVATLFWIGITGPVGFIGQERYFRAYYKGVPVSPRSYVKGKVTTWLTLISGAVLAVVLVYLSQTLFPHLFAVAIVYAFLAWQYPNGRAMESRTGNQDRAELYGEPK